MTPTNKTFAYVFNTPAKDHKVSRVLCNATLKKPSNGKTSILLILPRKIGIRSVASELFAASSGLASEQTADVELNGPRDYACAYPTLFLEGGFKLVESYPQYRDDVLKIGESAETALLTFLKQHNITARGAQNVLKSMRKLHKDGSLNQHILRYQQLQASGHILDPAPSHTTNPPPPCCQPSTSFAREEDMPREPGGRTRVPGRVTCKKFFEDEAVEDNTLNETEA
ncbi:hypothetical protein F442_15869 [Phytophthora nicotianae P10297]|uniref:Uncharacterized protein n=2 Tax=Phytophthora nicotianae TaxID=4792 RepID=W2YPI9_PHYNI|nr:hypothetical protein F444_16013 [Phytophthora nicotianae P1976]ETP36099.1 hypothetical protein F442_15869 [Phytophthora nicotianae P10297]